MVDGPGQMLLVFHPSPPSSLPHPLYTVPQFSVCFTLTKNNGICFRGCCRISAWKSTLLPFTTCRCARARTYILQPCSICSLVKIITSSGVEQESRNKLPGKFEGGKKKWEKKERYIFDLDKYIWKTIIFHRFELIVIFLFIFLNGSTRFLLTICRIVAIWLDLFPRHLICDIRNIKWLFKDERFRNCANSESGIIHLFPGRIRSYSIIRHSIPEF